MNVSFSCISEHMTSQTERFEARQSDIEICDDLARHIVQYQLEPIAE
jgi:hypothetical protein